MTVTPILQPVDARSTQSQTTPGIEAPWVAAMLAFVALFAHPISLLARDWWTNPEAGHGLLLFPVACWFVWRIGLSPTRRPHRGLGLGILIASVLLRYLSGLAAELFTMRLSALGALVGLTTFAFGLGQVRRWWLPFLLLLLSIPLPEIVIQTLSAPLQLRASRLGAYLLTTRHVQVRLDGNVIQLRGQQLFVTEACSGLRSLTALLSLGVLTSALWLRLTISRAFVVLATIPVAIFLNGVRVFLTGFLVYFVDPKMGRGFMHLSEGWLMFLVAFLVLGLVTWVVSRIENYRAPEVDSA